MSLGRRVRAWVWRRYFPGWALPLALSCSAAAPAPTEPDEWCVRAPIEAEQAYALEAAPIVASGACDGLTSATCPALEGARARLAERLVAFREKCA